MQPPPNVTGALHIGHALTATVEDADDPPRADAGLPDALAAGRRPRVDRGAGRARPNHRRGRRDAGLARPRALPRADVAVHQRDAPTSLPTSSGGWASRPTGAGCASRWTRARPRPSASRSSGCTTTASRIAASSSSTGARATRPACRTSRSSARPPRARCGPSATTSSTTTARRSRRRRSPSPRRGPRRSSATPRWPSIPTTRATRARSAGSVLIPFVDRVVPVIADDVVEPRLRHGRGQDHAGPRPRRLRDRQAPRPADDRRDDRRRPDQRARRRVRRPDARRGARAAHRGRPRGARRPGRSAVPHEMVIGRCQRSDDVVEPRLKTQWFINVKPMAEKAMAAVREGRTTFVPPRFRKVFFDWMENIHDWNVSRQLWWGHRIPAWYCPDGHITVSDAADGPTACDACGRPAAELRQDEDIFDTWFSSGLWPFSTLGWPDDTPDLRRYYPTTVMETGYDIIFFWVARMMMLGEWLTGDDAVPHGLPARHGPRPVRRQDVQDEGQRRRPARGHRRDRRRRAALRAAPRHGRRQADRRLGASASRARATSPTSSGTPRASSSAAGPPRCPRTRRWSLAETAELGPAEHWILDRCARDDRRRSRSAYAEFQFGEAAATALRRDLERLLRLVPRAGQGRTVRCRRRRRRRKRAIWSDA